MILGSMFPMIIPFLSKNNIGHEILINLFEIGSDGVLHQIQAFDQMNDE